MILVKSFSRREFEDLFQFLSNAPRHSILGSTLTRNGLAGNDDDDDEIAAEEFPNLWSMK